MSETQSPVEPAGLANGSGAVPDPFAAWSFNDPYSDRLVAFMSEGWGPLPGPGITVAPPPDILQRRRDALRAELGSDVPALVTSGRAPVRNDDVIHPVRASSDYVYLTGDQSAGGVLCLDPVSGRDDVLYLDVPAGRSGTEFYSDAARGELWVGPQPSLEAREQALGLVCRPAAQLAGRIGELGGSIVSGPLEPALDTLPAGSAADARRLTGLVSELRLIKDEWELGELRHAIEVTIDAFGDVRTLLRGRSSVNEREVEIAFAGRARREGTGPGYHVIAAGGHRATTLHWNRNDAPIGAEDLLLLDAGVELNSLYTGDLTRTWPVGGRFSGAQRQVYEHVLAAEQAAMACLRAGALFREHYDVCARVLAGGLADLGVLPIAPEESLSADSGLHRRWTLCAPGHMLGLDVHDCSKAREDRYIGGRLRAGMVLTVEPGLYFQRNDELVPEALRGVGIRIEDDVLITEDGYEVLSRRLPREIDELEAWCAS